MAEQQFTVPDLGDVNDVEVIELLVSVGDNIAVDDPIMTLESAKASMDIPSPAAGTITALAIKVGDKVNSGDAMLTLKVESDATEKPTVAQQASETAGQNKTDPKPNPTASAEPENETKPQAQTSTERHADIIHASPAVRRIATENNINLQQVTGSGPQGRITKADVQRFMGETGEQPAAPATKPQQNLAGKTIPLSRINKLSAQHLQQCWQTIPHVTHFDDADITELEAWRQQIKQQQPETKLSLLPFVMKAVVHAMQAQPRFNCSLSQDGEQFIYRDHYHLGIAVDTADGLIVPVILDVDKKSVLQLVQELIETAATARAGKLKGSQLQGGCFTISNLGGVGGQHFTPIINAPEAAILGMGQARWQLKRMGAPNAGADIADRLIQPLAVSYDHRIIDGAVAARFIAQLKRYLEDIREILL